MKLYPSFLRPGCAVFAATLLTGLSGMSTQAAPLRPLRSVSSTNGLLQTDLVIKNVKATLNGRQIKNLRTYNGDFPGPTLHAHPGDVLKIRYVNRLVDNSSHSGIDHHSVAYNSVNLHTHGLNVSPEGFSDNVYLEILPGQWVPFQFDIPANHPSGLFWYHPHRHGGTSTQVGSALTGNLILTGKGDLDEIPEVAAAQKVEMHFNEIPLVLDPSTPGDPQEYWSVPDSATDTFFAGEAPPPGPSPSLKLYTLNGAPLVELDSRTNNPTFLAPPELTMRPGEVQRWQITHAGLDQFLNLVLVDQQGKSQPLHLLSFDGITIPKLQTSTNALLLGDGNRAEFLVQAGPPGSKYTLKSIPNPDQVGFPTTATIEIPLLSITVSGAPVIMALPMNLNPPTSRLPDIQDSEIVRTRTITFESSNRGDFRADGTHFDPLVTSQTMLLNTAEEWLLKTSGITTNDAPLAHPFHIHVNWFQVTKINGIPVPPRWQDTVIIPFGGTVTIRHRFQQFTGKFVLHCHILPHEDVGMMEGVEVVDTNKFNALQSWRVGAFGSFENIGKSGDSTTNTAGVPNLMQYAYGATNLASPGLPLVQTVTVGGNDYYSFKFDWRISSGGVNNPVNYVLFESDDLGLWTPTSVVPVNPPVDKGNGFQTVTVRDTTPIFKEQGSRRFMTLTLQTEPVALPITPDSPE